MRKHTLGFVYIITIQNSQYMLFKKEKNISLYTVGNNGKKTDMHSLFTEVKCPEISCFCWMFFIIIIALLLLFLFILQPEDLSHMLLR